MNYDHTHLDLFSGIGGFALAAQRAGFRTVGFSEVEPSACRILAEQFPGIPNFGDVRKRESFDGIGSVTVLTGGFPCQPWSAAGRKLGERDNRNLWPAMLGVIEAVRPSWVIGENVPNIVRMGGYEQIATVLENIGYSAQPFTIPACAAGAPFFGDRLWIIAAPAGERLHRPGRCLEPVHTKTEAFREADRFVHAFQRNSLPFVCSRHDGVSRGVAQAALHGYGNAIVPQVVEPFFHWIRQIEEGEIA